jgi:glycosyltransferase involved in cell wall biosynthesis
MPCKPYIKKVYWLPMNKRRANCQLIDSYLLKQKIPLPSLQIKEVRNYDFIYIIPCYNEPDLSPLLESLKAASAPSGSVALLFVVNGSASDTASVKKCNAQTYEFLLQKAQEWQEPFTFLTVYLPELPPQKAGVGLARKIGMDLALTLFRTNPYGVIVNLDADCLVAPNYFIAIERFFKRYPTMVGACLYFEHPLGEEPEMNKAAIIQYELYLRYHLQALRWSGFPYSFHTVGSCMACRAYAYAAIGGMNQRKAGEDFYFLHKLIPFGAFGEIHTTCVYPSPRVSERVPFGTGRAMLQWQLGKTSFFPAPPPESYQALKQFWEALPRFFTLSRSEVMQETARLPLFLRNFLAQTAWQEKYEEIRSQTKSPESFQKRFFEWCNAFWVIKYLHFVRDNALPDIPVAQAAASLLPRLRLARTSLALPYQKSAVLPEELLRIYRLLERAYPQNTLLQKKDCE